MRAWSRSAAAVGETATLTALEFAALVAAGGVVKAAGGATWLAGVFAAVGAFGTLVALALGVLPASAQDSAESGEFQAAGGTRGVMPTLLSATWQ